MDNLRQLGDRDWETVLPSPAAIERAHGARLPLAVQTEPGAQEPTGLNEQLAADFITTEAAA